MTTSPDEPKKQHPIVSLVTFVLIIALIYYSVTLFCL